MTGPGGGQPGRDRALADAEVEDEPAVTRAAGSVQSGDQRTVTQEVGTVRVRRLRAT